MPWYEHWFDQDEYELVYPHRNLAEAEQVLDLLERTAHPRPDASVLDVGCGRGRHARVLARRGYDVTGIDLSERALEQARQRAIEEQIDVCFQQGDMREAVCEGCFDGVMNLFTAFGYFEHDADHLRAIQAMATALKPGGWLFQDFLNAPQVIETLVPVNQHKQGDFIIEQQRWIEAGRIIKAITLRKNGDAATFHESVRLLQLDDFRRLYAEAGLELLHTFGDYHGAPYTEKSPRLIMYATKQ